MSTDERVATDLVRTLEDGKNGYTEAAEKIAGDGRSDLAARFRELAAERATMSDQLQAIAASYGDDIDERGTAAAAVHRAWIAVKDALTGDDEASVIASVVKGEEHAVEQYDEALATDGVSPEFRTLLAEQRRSVDAALQHARGLKA